MRRKDQHRARQRLGNFLSRHGWYPPDDVKSKWTKAPAEIQEVVRALQALRGVGKVAAVGIVAELGSLSSFRSTRQLMSYAGRGIQ